MLKVVHDTDAPNQNGMAGGSLLDEIVRDGARAMFAAALQAEVAAYIDAHLGEVDEAGHRLVVRNGFHQPREVVTAAGAVGVRAPRVNDKRIDETTGERKRFSSAILPAWARKSPQVLRITQGRGAACQFAGTVFDDVAHKVSGELSAHSNRLCSAADSYYRADDELGRRLRRLAE